MTPIAAAKKIRLALLLSVSVMLSACVGTVVGAVADTAIEVIKVPFKVGGAIIDVVTPDGDELTDENNLRLQESATGSGLPVEHDAALKMENEGL
ncbi:MAG: NF038104 family lipoprotein [Pseudomonadota bacterium]